jgi:hypothetical protein
MDDESIVFGLAYAAALGAGASRGTCAVLGARAVLDLRAFHDAERLERNAIDDIGRGLRRMAWTLEEPTRAAESDNDDDIPF